MGEDAAVSLLGYAAPPQAENAPQKAIVGNVVAAAGGAGSAAGADQLQQKRQQQDPEAIGANAAERNDAAPRELVPRSSSLIGAYNADAHW